MRRTWLVLFSLPMVVSIPFSCYCLFQRWENPFGFQSSFEPSRLVCRGYGRAKVNCAYYSSKQSNECYSSESNSGAGSGAEYSCSTRGPARNAVRSPAGDAPSGATSTGSADDAAARSSACYAAVCGSTNDAAPYDTACDAAACGSADDAASDDSAHGTAPYDAARNAARSQCCQLNHQPPERSLQL